MRLRRAIVILICLLLAAGAWLLFSHRPAQKSSPEKTAAQIAAAKKMVPQQLVPTKVSPPKVLPAALTATNAAQAATGAKTNEFAYRLSNTAKTIGELQTDARAVLLQNAFIDTREPINLSIPKNLQAKGDTGAYIVQANGPVDNQFRTMLTSAGAQIVSYIPNNAYLVEASANVIARIQSAGFSGTVLPYEPYYKLSPSFLTEMEKNPEQQLSVSQLRVAAYPNSANALATDLQKSGARIIAQEQSPFGTVFTVQNVQDVAAMARMNSAQLIEPFHTRVIANDLARVTMGISTNTITASSWRNLSGSNVMVEVNDTGVDANHHDLLQNGSPGNPGSGAPRVTGDAIQSLVDTNGHGTHVAGIIAGNGSQSFDPIHVGAFARGSVTNADFRGKAPLAKLYSIGFLGDDTNIVSDRYLQEAAAQTNALISNNSWILAGDNQYDLSAASFDAAVRDALPESTGSQPILFVFAAGNNGNGDDSGGSGNPDTISSPATAKNVITVGALEQLRNITNIVTSVDANGNTNQNAVWQPQTDSDFQVAGYSARGNVGIGIEGTFGRFKPDVVAPGSFVVSLRSSQWDTNSYFNPTNHHYSQVYDFAPAESFGDPNSGAFFVYPNAVTVTIQFIPVSTFATNIPIYVWRGTDPNTASPDYSASDFVSLPAIPSNTGWACTVSNNTLTDLVYELLVDVQTTNDMGDYFQVLEGMDQQLAPYYRYESGSSIAAPAVSGMLALIQDYFTNTLQETPSPALLKAMLINGSRPTGTYNLTVDNQINYEGWGLPNLTNSLPLGITNMFDSACSEFFLDQNPTNALATGDSQTFIVTVTNAAQALPLRVTLAWTDPAGDPAAAIKLVNNLDLVVTNFSDPTNPVVYFGNDIGANTVYNSPWNTNVPPHLDSINNIENVFLPSSAGGSYSVTVVGRAVNVNSVTAQTNDAAGNYAPNVVQDFALVISCGEGEVTNAITVSKLPPYSNPTGVQNITYITATNTPLLNQFVGANAPGLGTNTVSFAASTNLVFGSNAVVTIGMTNQWHFYVVTNNGEVINGNVSNAPYAGFITFFPSTLSLPRMGVYEDAVANATRPEADIDLYVSTDPSLTNLNPLAISNCINGTQIGALAAGVFNGASLGRGGTEFVVDTNSASGQVYYIGVKSEDQYASEYGFISIFSATPFDQTSNGVETVNGLLLPTTVPDGSPAHPGKSEVFALSLQPSKIKNVIVSDQITHQNIGDLTGVFSHNSISMILNNHDSLANPPGPYDFTYDDSQYPVIGSQPSDGPGSLRSYLGQQAIGPWILTEVDNSLTQTGSVTGLQITIQPHKDATKNVTQFVLQPSAFEWEYVDVPVGVTNLTINATNITGTATDPVQLFVRYDSLPTTNNFDETTNVDPVGTISIGPPLQPGRYYYALYNPPGNATQVVDVSAVLAFSQANISIVDWNSTNATAILDDAVVTNSLVVTNTDIIQSLNVGLRVDHPRISDLVFHLISPDGTRYLLMENRGGTSTNGCGATISITTNIANFAANGNGNAQTNFVAVTQSSGVLPISWDFFTIPDQMTIYDGTNVIFDTGIVSNTGQANISFSTTNGGLTIIMNQTNNPGGGDQWVYSVGSVSNLFSYLAFTEDTNLTTTPIKFAPLPFVPTGNTNLFYQPEQDISPLNGQNAAGIWTLEIQDDRAGAGLTNWLMGWQLEFTFANTNFISTNNPSSLTNGVAATNVVPANGIAIFPVNVPANADFATNTLLFDTGLLNLWWSTNSPPTITNANDFELLTNSPGGESSILSTNGFPPLNPGGTYYLILQNTNSFDVTNALEVDFHLISLPITITNGQSLTNSTPLPSGDTAFFSVFVPTNADLATNILLFADAPLNIWWSTNSPPTVGGGNDFLLITNSQNGTNILSVGGTPPLIPGSIYYLGVQNTNSFAVTNFALEVDFHLTNNAASATNIVISSIISTNNGITNGFLLIWFAPSNDLFQVQWASNLPPVWNTFTNIVSYNTNYPVTPTNATFTFFDDGSQTGGFGLMRFYQLVLLQATNTITFPAPPDYTATIGVPLLVTNKATDSNPALTLNYVLTEFPSPATNAVIDTNGIISWTPASGEGGTEFKFTTVVSDNGIPPVSATNFFTVFVSPPPTISTVLVTATNTTLSWTAPMNDLFQIESTTNLASPIIWVPLLPSPISSTTGTFTFVDTNAPVAMKFYRLDWLPLP